MDDDDYHQHEEEGGAVGTESKPPRSLLDNPEADALYQDENETNNEDGEGAAGHEARDGPRTPVDYETLQEQADGEGEGEPNSHEKKDDHGDRRRQEKKGGDGEPSWNPSQGVQAEVREDAAGDKAQRQEEPRRDEAAPPQPPITRRLSVQRPDVQVISPAAASAPMTAEVHGETPNEGTVQVVIRVNPIGFRARLQVVVHREEANNNNNNNGNNNNNTNTHTNASSGDNNESENNSSSSPRWVLVAKDLFEAVAMLFKVHPQDFHIYRNSTERVRFMSMLYLETDKSARGGGRHAEPLWIQVRFPGANAEATQEEEAGAEETPHDEGDDLAALPPHLAQIGAEEQLLRCVLVRRAKVDITPQRLVEGKQRHGMSYQQVIDAISAAADMDENTLVPVAIVASAGPAEGKPFLGGYRDKRNTARTFHHAATQLFLKGLSYSPFGNKGVDTAEVFSRQTQTWGIARSCQTLREFAAQTPRRDLQLDLGLSLPVAARPYFTAAALLELRTAKAILLQKLYRQWKARAVRRGLEEDEMDKQRRAAARQRVEEAAKMDADQRAHLRIAEPKTASDFDQLKERIVAWRTTEAAAIQANAALTADDKRAASLALTKQELLLLQDLEGRRRATMLRQKDRQFDRTMEAMSSARVWGKVQVETPETTRAGELRDLYRALADTAQPQSSRLDVLLHVKWTVKEFNTAKTAELVELIDREADLLHRGRKETSLAGLRTRIQNLFKQFIEDPEYNPMMTAYTTTATGRVKARDLYGTVYGADGSVRDAKGASSTSHRSSLYLKKTNTI